MAITLRLRLNRKSRAAFDVRGSGGSTQPAIETGRGGKPEKGRVSNHTWRTGRMGRWGGAVPGTLGCGLRARGWGENQTLAEGRNWGRRSDTPEAGLTQRDDPRHATRPSFPRGLGCVREVALLALRKSKRLPTPEAFRPPQSLKKFISHHRGGGEQDTKQETWATRD